MIRPKIKTELIEIANQVLNLKLIDVNDDDNIIKVLGLDSINITSLIIEIEEHFEFEFSESELISLSDVKSLIDIVEQKI